MITTLEIHSQNTQISSKILQQDLIDCRLHIVSIIMYLGLLVWRPWELQWTCNLLYLTGMQSNEHMELQWGYRYFIVAADCERAKCNFSIILSGRLTAEWLQVTSSVTSKVKVSLYSLMTDQKIGEIWGDKNIHDIMERPVSSTRRMLFFWSYLQTLCELCYNIWISPHTLHRRIRGL